MNRKTRTALIAVLCIAALALAFGLLYFKYLPNASYRKLVLSTVGGSAVSSAEVITSDGAYPLTEEQKLAVISWFAEYWSENSGITRAKAHEGYELHLHYAAGDRADEVLYIEPHNIVFDGMAGLYRVAVETTEIYDMINDMVRR